MKRQQHFYWLVGIAAALYVMVAPRFYVGHFGDDARDILAARSLLHGAYRDLQVPGHPLLNFPLPGFPLFLAPFVSLLASHLECLKIIPIALTLGSLFLMRKLWESELSSSAMNVLVALVAFNPTTLNLSGCVIADAPYLFSVLLTFVLLRHRPSLERDAWLAIACAWAALLRPEGAFLIGSLGVALAFTRQKRSFIGMLCAGGIFGGVLLWNRLRTGSSSGYLSLFGQTLPILSRGVGTLLNQWGNILKTFILEVCLGVSLDLQTPFRLFLAAVMIWSGLMVILAGCARWLKSSRESQALLLAVPLYAFLHLWVHGVWLALDAHYLWPLLPFAAFFVVYGVDHMTVNYCRLWAGVPTAVLVFGLYSWQSVYAVRQTLDRPSEEQLPRKSFQWIGGHLPVTAFVLSPQASALTLYTGRCSMALVGGMDPDDFRYQLLERGLTDVVVGPLHFVSMQTVPDRDPLVVWRRIQTWLAFDPAAYVPVFQNDRERVQVYHVKPAPDFHKAYAKYREILQSISTQPIPDWSARLQQLEEVIQINPFPSALNAYGVTAVFSGSHLSLARRRVEEAVGRRQDFTIGWITLARLYRRLGNRTLAGEALTHADETLMDDQSRASLAPLIAQERQALK